jgi:hypothetical protein
MNRSRRNRSKKNRRVFVEEEDDDDEEFTSPPLTKKSQKKKKKSEEEEDEEDEDKEESPVRIQKTKNKKSSPRMNSVPSPKKTQTEKDQKMKLFSRIENNARPQDLASQKKLKDIYEISPKIKVLIETIKALDEDDLKNNKKLYKHYIFSRLDGNGGINLIKKAFALELDDDRITYFTILDENGRSSVEVLKEFNDHKTNPGGKKIRLIGLSKKFKEGIDLKDVKYAHIFEKPSTSTDLQQIIGRGTRFCGQKNMEFPWNLDVFIYRLSIPSSMRKTYKHNRTGEIINLNREFLDDVAQEYRSDLDKYIQHISKYAHYMAVDFSLTQDYIPLGKNVQKISISGAYDDLEPLEFSQYGEDKRKKITSQNFDFIKNRRKFDDDDDDTKALIKAAKNLLGNKNFQFDDDIYQAIYDEEKKDDEALIKASKNVLGRKNFQFDDEIQRAIEEDGKKQVNQLADALTHLSLKNNTTSYNGNLGSFKDGSSSSSSPALVSSSFSRNFHKSILQKYGKLRWKKPDRFPKCEEKKEPFVAKLNMTQEFLIRYFTPESSLKGMLVWHSVGSGKTCTAIGLASSYFEEQNWRIILVTRSSLKDNFYKNIFGTVCHQKMSNSDSVAKIEKALNEKGYEEEDDGKKENTFIKVPPPATQAARSSKNEKKNKQLYTKLLDTKLWTEPISHKQFSNLCVNVNKNKLGLSGVQDHIRKNKRNDENRYDPLYKTLIIIDEAHYLLKDDKEDSDPKVDIDQIKKALYNSHVNSGANSAKVLLMTATPMNEKPYEFIQLMNLLKTESDQIVETEKEFIQLLDNDMDGKDSRFMNFIDRHILGYVSYLDRSKDPGYFAQTDKPVEIKAIMSKAQEESLKKHKLFTGYKEIESQDSINQKILNKIRLIEKYVDQTLFHDFVLFLKFISEKQDKYDNMLMLLKQKLPGMFKNTIVKNNVEDIAEYFSQLESYN